MEFLCAKRVGVSKPEDASNCIYRFTLVAAKTKVNKNRRFQNKYNGKDKYKERLLLYTSDGHRFEVGRSYQVDFDMFISKRELDEKL